MCTHRPKQAPARRPPTSGERAAGGQLAAAVTKLTAEAPTQSTAAGRESRRRARTLSVRGAVDQGSTVTLLLPLLTTYTLEVRGSTATASGSEPTATVVVALVAPSITVTVLLPALTT